MAGRGSAQYGEARCGRVWLGLVGRGEAWESWFGGVGCGLAR